MKTPSRHLGFTLVEMMSSMAIGGVLLLAAASILGASGSGYERMGGSIATEREARALMSQLAADFATAKFHKDQITGKSTASWPVDQVGFMTLQPSHAQSALGRIGDVCAVNYYVKDLAIGGSKVRCLMRRFRESKDAFTAIRDGTVADLFKIPADTDPAGNDAEPIAFGVVSFEARPLSRDNSGNWNDWVKNDTTGPEGMAIKLVVARRGLANRLRTSTDWDGSGTAATWLGAANDVRRNEDLEVYESTIHFGYHDSL